MRSTLSSASGLTAQAGFDSPTGSFAGDENGDGFADFALQGVSPGTPEGIDTNQLLLIQAGELTLGTAGDVDGDGYSDIISSLSPRLSRNCRDAVRRLRGMASRK